MSKKSKKPSNPKESKVETPKEKQPKEDIPTSQAEVAKQEEPLTLEGIQKELNLGRTGLRRKRLRKLQQLSK